MELKSIDIKTGFKLVIEKINALNPLSVLARGYGILEKEGKIINCVDSLSVGDKITVKLADGDASASVSEITKTRNFK
jgi:exodeoxyribonuclease VII large subunit